jgi:DNA-directed RNA polymerase specialized sigma24 family protein
VGNSDSRLEAHREAFATTHWSVVLAAGGRNTPESAKALETLCQTYWYPLYAYVRRRGYAPADAQDLTQQFFARFLEKGSFHRADPARGRFRSFLLKSLQHFLADDWKRAHRVKRGRGAFQVPLDRAMAEARFAAELTDTVTPERAYDEHWAMTLLEHVLGRMREEYTRVGKEGLFDALQDFLWDQDPPVPRAVMAKDLGLTEGALHAAVHRLRQHYRERLRSEVACTVDDPEQVDGELRYLITVMSVGS